MDDGDSSTAKTRENSGNCSAESPTDGVAKNTEESLSRKEDLKKALEDKLLPITEGPSEKDLVKSVGIRQSKKEKLLGSKKPKFLVDYLTAV